MESHRPSGSPDIRTQRGYMLEHSHRGSQDNSFGVRIQVQGIKGQPYVVLNSSSQDSNRDVSVITHQAGYNPGMARRSMDDRQLSPEPQKMVNSPVFNYQKRPEIMRSYSPENNKLSPGFPSQTASNKPTTNVTKTRIPLPAEGPGEDPAELTQNKAPPSGGQISPRSPNLVETDSIISVGKLISQFNSNQRRGRGPRNRLNLEECRRSRSVDSSRTSESSSPSPSASRNSSLKGGMYPPGSARARLLSGEVNLKPPSNKDTTAKGLHRAEKASSGDRADESDERDAQVQAFVLGQSCHLKDQIYLPYVP